MAFYTSLHLVRDGLVVVRPRQAAARGKSKLMPKCQNRLNGNAKIAKSIRFPTLALWVNRGGMELSRTGSAHPPPGQKTVPPKGNLIMPIHPPSRQIQISSILPPFTHKARESR